MFKVHEEIIIDDYEQKLRRLRSLVLEVLTRVLQTNSLILIKCADCIICYSSEFCQASLSIKCLDPA